MTAVPREQSEPQPTEIREALARLSASETLRNSPQLAAFLAFVVEAALRGETDRIKGYTIGVEALGRSERFDPQSDPIVRVEATRLRRAMARYYAEEGARDPIIIELPRGSYVPLFRSRVEAAEPPPATSDEGPPPAASGTMRPPAGVSLRMLVVFAALLAIGAVLGARAWPPAAETERPAAAVTNPTQSGQTARPQAPDQIPPGNGQPNLAIAPFSVTGLRGGTMLQASTLRDKISDAFSLFDTANIVTYTDSSQPVIPGADNLARPDYVLHATVEYHADTTTTLRFRLVDAREGSVIWSFSFDRLTAAADPALSEENIIVDLASMVMQPYGVIRSHERSRQLAGNGLDDRRRCIVVASESVRTYDPQLNKEAQECLRRVTGEDPGFALGHAYLSVVYFYAARNGFDLPPSDTPIEDETLAAAQRGVHLRPESARVQSALCLALHMRGDRGGADKACQRAIALNRYDMIMRVLYGAVLVSNGEIERGREMLLSASRRSPVRAASYYFFLFAASYMLGDAAAAAQQADRLASESNEFGLLARTLALQLNGDKDGALRIYQRLTGLKPGWRTKPDTELRRYFHDTKITSRMAADLTALGQTVVQ